MATIGNAPVFPTESVLPGNLQVTGNATVSGNATINGTTNSVGALTENSNEVLNVTNTTFFNVDYWYLNANQSNGDITSGWVRAADTQPTDSRTGTWNALGPAMTESSGVFTFPSTGVWRVTFTANTKNNASSGTDTVYPIIKGTENNSVYATMVLSLTALLSATKSNPTTCSVYFDCQDTSNYKILFSAGSITNGYIEGVTTNVRSFATFEKMGET